MLEEQLKNLIFELKNVYNETDNKILIDCVGLILLTWLFLSVLLPRLHYKLTAQKPQIICQPTKWNKFILEHCPSLSTNKFYPSWYLFNSGHLHTILLSIINDKRNEHPSYQIEYERETFHLKDGGILSLDWAFPINTKKEQKKKLPTLFMLHGLTGGSDELYIRSLGKMMVDLGWRVVVMNARGCGKTPFITPKAFCAAYTDDVREVVNYIKSSHIESHGNTRVPFAAVGYSLGSNILVKYVGEEGEKCAFTAAISVGNPYDLLESSRSFDRSFISRFYHRALANNCKKFVRDTTNKALEVFKDHPTIDTEYVLQSRTLAEFDDRFTSKAFGYKTLRAYYRAASSDLYLLKAKIPLLCISAEDDPISSVTAIPTSECQTNPNVILCLTHSGGHLGFFYENSTLEGTSTEMYSSKMIAEYLCSIEKKLTLKLN